MTAASPKRRIGILGGMGPEATVLLMSRIVAMTPAQDDSDHVPLLVDNNTQVPSRIKAIIEKTGEDPGPVLVDMARRLANSGVAALAMPCNTAHHYAGLIAAAVPMIPFLNMIELSADHVAELERNLRNRASRRVGMLASPAVRVTGIFDRAFAARRLETLYPSDPNRMLACIKAIKADSRDAKARGILKESAEELRAEGADVLLVACSELSIIADVIPKDLPVVDTIDVLAGAVVAFSGGPSVREISGGPIDDRAAPGGSA
ncbi:MAG TPA: amino acid racemase [Hyphomicrobiaceae bacterium]